MGLIRLVAGDWSGDGYDKTETRVYEMNCTKDQFIAAWVLGKEKLNLNTKIGRGHAYYEEPSFIAEGNLMLPFCNDYEDYVCNNEDDAEKLGLQLTDESGVDEYALNLEGDGNPNDWFEVNIRVARLGLPNLVAEEIKDTSPTINICGYGLFF